MHAHSISAQVVRSCQTRSSYCTAKKLIHFTPTIFLLTSLLT